MKESLYEMQPDNCMNLMKFCSLRVQINMDLFAHNYSYKNPISHINLSLIS